MTATTRRRFLLGGLGVVALAGALPLVWARSRDTGGFVARAVQRNLRGFAIRPADLEDFARGFEERRAEIVRRRSFRLAVALSPLFFSDRLRSWLPDERRYEIELLERLIVSDFVLSTDLLQREPNANGTLAYYGYPDPYQRGCANVLARFG